MKLMGKGLKFWEKRMQKIVLHKMLNFSFYPREMHNFIKYIFKGPCLVFIF